MTFETACILAIGTELTCGQVINSNAAWLAQRLTDLGIQRCWHLTVPDERTSIHQALQTAEQQADLLIITGGLGPTADDFTREVVAQWLNKPLIYDPMAWHHIETRARMLEFELTPTQKRQCYFPEGAQILPNPSGTAHAFICQKEALPVFVLPGPPREIQALWKNGLRSALLEYLPGKAALQLFRWQCLGLPEAHIAEKVEAVLVNSKLQTGYRVHTPYVEVKVWIPPEIDPSPWLNKVETVLEPWIVARQDEDPALLLGEYLRTFPSIHIFDAITAGALGQRLSPVLQNCEQAVKLDCWYHSSVSADAFQALIAQVKTSALVMAMTEVSAGCLISLSHGTYHQELQLSPLFPPVQISRNRSWYVEKAILFWYHCLHTNG